MKKYIYLAFALLLGSWTFISCGDEEDNVIDPLPLGIPVDAPLCPVTVNPTVMPKEGLVIRYILYNSEGKQTNEFKYGEDIIFSVEFQNLSDTMIKVAGFRDSDPRLFPTPWYDGNDYKKGIFNVHTLAGKFMGYPYETVNTLPDEREWQRFTYFYPKNFTSYDGIVRWCSSWLNRANDIFEVGLTHWYALYLPANNKPLPVGEYVTQFNVNIGKDASYPLKVEFKVINSHE